MTELERALVALGRELELPEPPDVSGRVMSRLDEPQGRPAFRRVLAVALAVLVVAVGIAFAVPPARSAILDWLGFGGVEIRRVEVLPEPAGGSLGLGVRTTLAEARRLADFPVGVPEVLGRPDEVWFASTLPGGQVALVYRRADPAQPTLLLTQFRANGLRFIEKSAGPGTSIESVTVGGEAGAWLTGEPHFFAYVSPAGDIIEQTTRLAGNVLIWLRGEVTFRLEGVATREEALRIAASVH